MKNKINADIMRSHSSFFILHSSFTKNYIPSFFLISLGIAFLFTMKSMVLSAM